MKYKQDQTREALFESRDFNYYFPEGTEVTIDIRTYVPSGFDKIDLTQFMGIKGIVKRVHSDLHAFSRGTSYMMDVDFNGELVKNIYAAYVIKYENNS